MGFQVIAKAIGKEGPLLDDKALKRDIARTNQKFARRMKRSFQGTTKHFSHTVIFQQETNVQNATIAVFTTDPIYFYLDQGTSVRYAIMSHDFTPQTRPGSLSVRPGSGGKGYLNVNNPQEGIEARRFAELVEAKHAPDYILAIQADLDRATRKST